MASPLSPLENATLNSISCEPAAKRAKTTRYQTKQDQDQDQEQRAPLVSFSPGIYDIVHASSVTTTTTAYSISDDPITSAQHFVAMDSATDSPPASSSPFMTSIDTASPTETHHHHTNDHRNHSSQENVSPRSVHSKPVPSPAMASSTATITTAPPSAFSSRQARPGSRILSGSELSPLKILQGRVTGGPSSSAASSVTLGSPASPDSGAESRRDAADDAVSSTTSSPPPTFPPTRRMSTSSNQMLPPALPLGRTPRKGTGPEKRFPVKISVPAVASPTASPVVATPVSAAPISPSQAPVQRSVPPSPSQPGQVLFTHIHQQQQPLHGRQMSLDEAIQLNEGLQQAIEIFEDETSAIENEPSSKPGRQSDGGSGTPNGYHHSPYQHQHRRRDSVTSGSARGSSSPANDPANADDTMLSTFSTFSAVPNTMSRAGAHTYGANSPNKGPSSNVQSRRGSSAGLDSVSGRPPRISTTTGRLSHSREHSNTTNLLMDFTEQLRQQNSSYRGDPSAATPQRKNLVNLLDFDIPPLPTPRSIPSVTPRELESLKSNFLSEISSLKASLSGKEAEVTALKTAVGDAEKRVGECMEQIREERGARDLVAEEKDQWERRGREMEDVLRKVKGEIVLGHRDRDELEAKLDESEKRREAAEMMAQEAETKMAAMRAGRATAEAESNRTRSPGGSTTSSSMGSSNVQREVEIAVERVARELHMAYKAKHETKVAALKKSYEARWEKRVRELETVAEALASENEKLRMSRDAALTRMAPSQEEHRVEGERRKREARDATQIKALGAEVENLEAVLRTVKADNSELRTLLEQERVEKGELVIMAEELMAMQQQQQSYIAANTAPTPAPAPAVKRASVSSATSNGSAMSPRKTVPKTPRPGSRTSIGGPPVSAVPASANRNSMMVSSSSNNNVGSTATTPGRARPMSMHGTGRLSGLKPPSSSTMSTGGVPSRIGRIGHDRKMSSSNGSNGSNSSAGSAPRPPSGLGTRSGLMSSIEKMGRGRE
ncbi:hypothetical protein F503_05006 [Ophiostoma piceae UAMH 11346]|uniref:Kinetoplast-associated protein kap n=1 Tax=Ophiostoma piceae (strain UAMH 11346) TaxID=1262450 RepID=S3CD22_OPHP1|nr:hypothetical protein F503_05006 [Ophiostoma piceae UAMH 11346]